MPNYLWKARDGNGKMVAVRRPAASVKDAQTKLLQEGFTDLELQTDDIAEAAGDLFEEKVEVTPEEDLKFRKAGSFSLMRTLWNGFTAHKRFTFAMLLCLAHGIYRHRPYQTLIAGFCLVAWPLFVLWISLPGYYYSRLNQAKVWHRWDEVLGCVQAIRKIAKWSVVKFPEVELDKCTAQALASEGRLEEGLRIFEKHSATVPPFLYCSQVSTIYDAAKEQDKALEYAEKAVELAPENGTLLLDLAFRLSMHHNRPAESRALLARVDQSVLIPYARAYVPFVEGIILFRENRFDEARAELLKAVAGIGKFLHQDLTRGSWLLAKSYLCAAEQKLGNFSAVKKLWKETQQFLVAHREDELIALCEPVSAVPVR